MRGWREAGFDQDPDTLPIYGRSSAAATPQRPAAATSTFDWRKAGFDEDPNTLPVYGASTATPAAPPPRPKSTLVGSAIRGTGQVLSAAGRAAQDIGLPTKGIEDYGTRLQEEHPADVNTLSDVIHHPIQTIKETAGELAPQIGLNLAGAFAGARAGGALGALAGEGVGAVPGALVGGLIGGFAPNFVQEYGGIRQTQDQTGVDDKGRALVTGAAAAAVDLLEPETMVPRKIVTKGLEAVEKKGLKQVGKAALKGAAMEAAGETVQTGLERVGADQDLLGADAGNDYALSAIKGAIGGGAIGAVGHVIAPHKAETPAAQPGNDQSETAPMVDTASDATAAAAPAAAAPARAPYGPPAPLGASTATPLAEQLETHLKAAADVAPGAPAPESVTTLAVAISEGGDSAATALADERKSIDADHADLLKNAADLPQPEQNSRLAELATREKVLVAAQDAAAQLAQSRSPTLVTQPGQPAPVVPNIPGPTGLVASQTTLADQLRQEEANEKSASSQAETAQYQRQRSKVERKLRIASLQRLAKDPSVSDLQGAFLAHLDKVGFSTDLSAEERATIADQQTHKDREAAQQAIEDQKARLDEAMKEHEALQEQDTTLGVKEAKPRAEAAPAVAAEPVVAPQAEAAPVAAAAPAAAPAPVDLDKADIKARSEAHITRRELGSTTEKWFREGVKSAQKEPFEAPPKDKPELVGHFQKGVDFVKEEQEHLDNRRALEAQGVVSRPTREQGIAAGLKQKGEARAARKAAKREAVVKARKPVAKKVLSAATKTAVEAKPTPKPAPKPVVAKKAQPAAAKKAVEAKPKPKAEAKPKPAPKPKAAVVVAAPAPAPVVSEADKADAQARKKFKSDVDYEVGKTISAFQAQKLNMLAEATSVDGTSEDGKPTVFPTDVLRPSLEAAQAEYVKAGRNANELGRGETFPVFLGKATTAVKAQQLTRRGLLRGTPGMLAAGLASVKAEARTAVSNNTAVTQALKSGGLHQTVQAIADTTKNPAYRVLAKAMLLGGFANGARIEVWDMGDDPLTMTGVTDTGTGHVKVFHTTKGGTGLSEETILHEALHSWVAARYKDMNGYRVGPTATPTDQFIKTFDELHQQFRKMMHAKFPDMIDRNSDKVAWWAHFAAGDVDEFFVRAFTQPELQDFLRTHNMAGDRIGAANPTSIWAKLVQMIRNLFGLKPPTSILDKAMDAGWAVIKSGTLDAPRALSAIEDQDWHNYARDEGGRQMFRRDQPEAAQVREGTEPGKTKAMMVGQNAATKDLDALDKAVEFLTKAGATPENYEAARRQFGWHFDTRDRMWKFEIDDSGMRFKTPFGSWPMSGAKLGDLVKHPALIAAYPDLANVNVKVVPGTRDASYLQSTNTITIGAKIDSPMKALVHELQHVVQTVEGFARGGSPMSRDMTNPKNLDKIQAYYERIRGEVKQYESFAPEHAKQLMLKIDNKLGDIKELRHPDSDEYKAAKELKDAEYGVRYTEIALEKLKQKPQGELPADTASRQALIAHAEDVLQQENARVEKAVKDLNAMGSYLSIRDTMYDMMAGEVEARTAEDRLHMTADQRRATSLESHSVYRPEEQAVTYVSGGQALRLKYSRMSADETNDRVTGNPPPIPPTGPLSTSPDPAGLPPRMTTPEAIKVRSAVHQAASSLNLTAKNLLKKGFLYLAETEDIVNLGKKFMPSLVALNEAHSRGLALGRDMRKQLVNFDDRIRQLPAALQGTKPGSISDFLADSTTSGKWGFTPDWTVPSEVDPALVKRFKEIERQSPEAAQIIKEMFKFNHDARIALGEATLGTIDEEYDPQIKEAEDAGDTKKQTDLANQKADAITYFSRVFNTQDGLPYMSTARSGSWAVMGRSQAYRDAVTAGDNKAVDKMRDDPDHLFVNFYNTAAEADVAHGHMLTKFGKEGSYLFERGRGDNQGISAKEMLMTLKRFESAMDDADLSPRQGARMKQMARDFYLHSLSENSARKAELHRENVPFRDPVTREVIDMVDTFLTRGTANADYIASLANHGEVQKALHGMRKEVSAVAAPDATNAHRIFNEVMDRYEANLGAKPNRVIDHVVKGTSLWMLTTSPFYHIQNGTQAVLISQPALAKHVGYVKAMGHFKAAYAMWMNMVKGKGFTNRIDYENAPTPELRVMLAKLAKRGRLDSGLTIEDRPWYVNGDGLLPKSWNKFDHFMRVLPQRIETMNRVVTAVAAYNAMIEKGKSVAEATDFASELVRTTHGDYSGWNSSRVFQSFGGWGRVAGQFRKFTMIMAANVFRDFKTAYSGATLEEKMVGVKGIAFLSAHMMAVGGVLGLPGASFFGPMIAAMMNMLTGDDKDDWSDWQESLRKALGAGDEKHPNVLADILFKGAPYSLGADTSNRIGLGTMLALAPFSGADEAGFDRAKWYSVVGQVMLGPAGNIAAKALGGFDYGVNHDDWSRLGESLTPGFIGSTFKAARLKTHGLVNKAGLELIKPEDISWSEAALVAAGVNPSQLANQSDRGSALYDATQFYEGKTAKLKTDYVKAFKAHDASQLQDIREEWQKLQAGRRKDGFKTQPMSTLIKAPHQLAKRQAHVAGGVEYTKSNRKFVLDMLHAQDDAEDAAEAEAAAAP